MKRVLLYFGSFNPVHRGHIALAEYAVERGLGDEAVLVVSPQNPLKEASDLAPELARFEMAEIACAASKYPDRIKPSAVEFLLPKPSYTIDTLHYLAANCGDRMRFSILMGGDQIERLDRWKSYREILADYPIYVYPRRGGRVERFLDRITLLEDAPLLDCSATTVRTLLGRGEEVSHLVHPDVLKYIRAKGLWSPEAYLAALSARIERDPESAELLVERGRIRFRRSEWGEALNDFNRALRLDPTHREAAELVRMVQDILAFRYKDIYNP